jgi:hypothetical protein
MLYGKCYFGVYVIETCKDILRGEKIIKDMKEMNRR